jgi:hypothetical protein
LSVLLRYTDSDCPCGIFKLFLSFCPFSFGHCVVCSSSIYGFWLPLWYLQTLLVLSSFFFRSLCCLFFRNACAKSGSLRFSQFSDCWLILSVYIIMSFDFPFVRLFGVREFCYYPYIRYTDSDYIPLVSSNSSYSTDEFLV